MRHDVSRPFASIESALEFMQLLETAITDACAELEEGVAGATDARAIEGYTLALFKTRQLLFHTQKSRRILNDLTLVRAVMSGASDSPPS